MTRHDLEQIYYLKKELKIWQERLKELEADIAPPVKQITGMPFANTNEKHSPTEDKAIRLSEHKDIVKAKEKEVKRAIYKAEKFILTLEDSQMRIILELRCIGFWSWQRIADYMGEGYSSEGVRQTYSRFMKGLKNGQETGKRERK